MSSFRRGRSGRAVVATILTALFITSCAGERSRDDAHALTAIRDDAGRIVAAARPPSRIISLVPSVTDLIVTLNAGDRLVGRTAFDFDPRIAHVTSLGSTLRPGVEAMARLQPDLVIAGLDLGDAMVRQLEALDIAVYFAEPQSVADVLDTATRVGRILGIGQRADSLALYLRSGLERLRACSAHRARPSVLYVLWPSPPRTAAAGTYVDELISIAGGRNVFDDLRGWPEVGIESIVRRDPDYLVVARSRRQSGQSARLDDLAGWRELLAFRERHVVVVDADVFNRPGPGVLEAADTLARALHPGMSWSCGVKDTASRGIQ